MSVTFTIRGIRPDYEVESAGKTWANFHNQGAREVCSELGLDQQYGEIRARTLADICGIALSSPSLPDSSRRRISLLAELAGAAGDLGLISYG